MNTRYILKIQRYKKVIIRIVYKTFLAFDWQLPIITLLSEHC